MRVNSAFRCFFNNRLVTYPGVAVVILVILLIGPAFTNRSDRDLRAKQANIIVRQMGHRLLLQSGDSTSRVMPVTEINEGTFLLQFENELVFNHDSLMALTQALFTKTQFPSGYTVTVHECLKDAIVYGFQINNVLPDLIPCKGRREPSGCYTIEIAFPDLFESVEQNKADVASLPDEPKASKADANAAPDERTSSQVEDQQPNPKHDNEGLKAGRDNRLANPKPEEFETASSDFPIHNLVYGGMAALLSVALWLGLFRKRFKPAPVQNNDHSEKRESVPQGSALGKFLFNAKDRCLSLGSEVIHLTDKECKVLELLNNSFGELIARETLMQEVWINEGVITGRSLDMFVSKLRKKLSGDPELRITNVHGKGYKIEEIG